MFLQSQKFWILIKFPPFNSRRLKNAILIFMLMTSFNKIHAQNGDNINFDVLGSEFSSVDVNSADIPQEVGGTDSQFNAQNVPEDPQETFQPEEKPDIQIPYANSPIFLTRLAKMEREVYHAMIQYEAELMKRLQILKSYRQDYEDSVILPLNLMKDSEHLDEWSNAYAISSHPLLAYRMIRRFSKYVNAFYDHIWKSLENEVWDKLENIRGHLSWPTDVDLESATRSVIRIQDTHDFDINFFAAGVLRDYPLQIGLTAEQCLEISKSALKSDFLSSATEWFQIAHSKVTLGKRDESIGLDELTELWEATYTKFQSIWPMSIFKTHDVFSESKMMLREDFQRLKMNRTYENRMVNYKALCRGDKIKSPLEESTLICYLDNTVHPYWYLQPLQVEIHNWNPFLYQIYNFIGPQELLDINIVETIPGSVASTESGDAANQEVFQEKSFTTFWIPEELTLNPLRKLSKKLDMLTHRIGKLGPQFHFSMFAVGNHHEPCVKCIEIDSRVYEYGTPKLQVSIVLHEPDLGGEVAFTMLGSLVQSVKGSLIFFNTIGLNGEFDYMNLHGSCPIVLGQKWVATKWVY